MLYEFLFNRKIGEKGTAEQLNLSIGYKNKKTGLSQEYFIILCKDYSLHTNFDTTDFSKVLWHTKSKNKLKDVLKFEIVLKQPKRRFKVALRYIKPRRLTMNYNPPIYAWLWWNFTIKEL